MNLRIRFQNPTFVIQLILAVITPILAYAGLSMEELTTWGALGKMILHALQNPYVLCLVVVSAWNAVNDPTSKGVLDSLDVMRLNKCKNGGRDC